MNLYIRLFWTMLYSRVRSKISILSEYTSHHLVWPNDLDLLGHVNNGRYFTITDCVRIGILIRAGIWKEVRKRNIMPLVAGETAQFRKPLKPFQKYCINTRILGWDKRFLYIEHKFVSSRSTHAVLLIKVAFLGSNKTLVPPANILKLVLSEDIQETKMSRIITDWISSSDKQWSE